MEINYKQINEILSNLNSYSLDKKFKKVQDQTPDNYHEEKNQGEEGQRTVVYDVKLEGVYLKVTYVTDSYGDNETVGGIEFVKPQTKQVVVFETIN